jgi:hypothetical protein
VVFQTLIGNAIKYHSEEPPMIRIDAGSKSWAVADLCQRLMV